jgi:tetratricopeptide (TPR) repeat protein
MDCRRYLAAALTLLGGVTGCSSRQPTPQPTATPQLATANVRVETPPPKKTPEGIVSVDLAYGAFCEKELAASNLPHAERDKKLDQARRAYEQALSINAASLPAIHGLARVASLAGDQEKAITIYRQAIQKHPKEASLWFDLGMCHARRKEWAPAVQSMETALELDPRNRNMAKGLGLTLARAGRIDESVACLTKVFGPAQAHYSVARMLHHLNQDDLSRQHLQYALQVDPNLGTTRDAQELMAALQGPTSGVVTTNYQVPVYPR